MAEPTERDWQKLVRLARYLKARPRLVLWYEYQSKPDYMLVYTDTDWAGCRKTRRSTTGGCAVYGSHLIKMWSRTQALVALSSAEAELYGIVKGTAELKGLVSLWRDLGLNDWTPSRGRERSLGYPQEARAWKGSAPEHDLFVGAGGHGE